MAITRAQQFKQMLREGGRIGFKGGADMGTVDSDTRKASARSVNISPTGGVTTSAKAPSAPDDRGSDVQNLTQQLVREGKTPKEIRRITGVKNPIQKFAEGYTKNTRKFLYNTFPNNPSNELDYLKQLPAAQRALLSPALRAKLEELEDAEGFDDIDSVYGGKFTFNEFEELRKFQPTEGLNFAEYAAKFKGAPGLLYSGDVGNLEKFVTKRDAEGRPLEYGYRRKTGDDDPSSMESDLEARLRKLEEQRKEVEEPVAENPLANLFARLMADGGRVGIMNGGRIGFKGGADMATVAGDTTPARKGSVNISSSGGVTFDPSGRDDGPDDRSNLVQNVTQRLVREGVEPKEIRRLTNNQTFLDRAKPFLIRGGLMAFNPVLGTIGGQTITAADVYNLYGGYEAATNPMRLGLMTDKQKQIIDKDIKMGDAFDPDATFKSAKVFDDKGETKTLGLFGEDRLESAAEQVVMTREEYDNYVSAKLAEMKQNKADGGRIGAMEGGIMDLETGRQMYFLGKLVKKATRAVKKIVKSPIGKAAILGFGANALMSGGLGTFLRTKAAPFLFKGGEEFAAGKMGLGKLLSSGLTGGGMLALGGALTAAPLLFGRQEEDDTIDPALLGPTINIAELLANPYRATLGTGFRRTAADGGRMGYQEGSKEPVAKKTMPLLDMDGQEMDLRDNGGFVPIGRMEKADDVPARLSKNEFVFTADAVRNAGDGDIDKGAEVMYNMMKNLEDGGNVSEESQGLEGARNMFQTAQRLEEVL